MNFKAESLLWPVAYLRDCLHGSFLRFLLCRTSWEHHCWGFHWESNQAMLPHATHCSWIQQEDPQAVQLEQCLSSEQSCDCCHNPKLRPGWGWGSPRFGFVLTFGLCSQHRSQHVAAHMEIQLQALKPPCWALHWQYLQFCHVLKPHTNLHVQLCSVTMLLLVLLGPQTWTEAHCNSVCWGLHFYLPTLTLNTLVAPYEGNSLNDKQLNLHFSYLTCTFKISSYFHTPHNKVLT